MGIKKRTVLSAEATEVLERLLKALKTTAECGTAWDALRDHYNELRRREAHQARIRFEVGDLVEFETNRFPFKVQGMVVSIGDTNIKVKQLDGKLTWRVYAGLLKKVAQPAAKP